MKIYEYEDKLDGNSCDNVTLHDSGTMIVSLSSHDSCFEMEMGSEEVRELYLAMKTIFSDNERNNHE